MKYATRTITDQPETLQGLQTGQWIDYQGSRGRWIGRSGATIWIAWGGSTIGSRWVRMVAAYRDVTRLRGQTNADLDRQFLANCTPRERAEARALGII
jgi:hypothetical protein